MYCRIQTFRVTLFTTKFNPFSPYPHLRNSNTYFRMVACWTTIWFQNRWKKKQPGRLSNPMKIHQTKSWQWSTLRILWDQALCLGTMIWFMPCFATIELWQIRNYIGLMCATQRQWTLRWWNLWVADIESTNSPSYYVFVTRQIGPSHKLNKIELKKKTFFLKMGLNVYFFEVYTYSLRKT